MIEAGPEDLSWRIAMPAAVGSLLSSDRFNWNYVSDPEPGLDGRRLTHPRGRVLGGSSSINGMVYIRGHARDYDGWAAAGLRGLELRRGLALLQTRGSDISRAATRITVTQAP